MLSKRIRGLCLVLASLCLSSVGAFAEEPASADTGVPVNPHLAAMDRLTPLLGSFEITGLRYTPDGPVALKKTEAVVESILGGYGLQEMSQSDFGMDDPVTLQTTFSYDPHRKIYRVSAFDDTFGLMDIYEGRFASESVLRVTNLRSDTYFPAGPDGERMHFQLMWDLGASPKTFHVLMSQDGGASWAPFYEMMYTPIDEGGPD